jgi:hypothetical protein
VQCCILIIARIVRVRDQMLERLPLDRSALKLWAPILLLYIFLTSVSCVCVCVCMCVCVYVYLFCLTGKDDALSAFLPQEMHRPVAAGDSQNSLWCYTYVP